MIDEKETLNAIEHDKYDKFVGSVWLGNDENDCPSRLATQYIVSTKANNTNEEDLKINNILWSAAYGSQEKGTRKQRDELNIIK
jgi:hypothetical protein